MAAAFEHLPAVCRARGIACGGAVTPANAALPRGAGVPHLHLGGADGGLTAANTAARDAVAAVAAAERRGAGRLAAEAPRPCGPGAAAGYSSSALNTPSAGSP